MSFKLFQMRFFPPTLALFIVSAVMSARTANGTAFAAMGQDVQLNVIGTAVADNQENSVAVIEWGNDGKQHSYHVGQRAGGVLIKKILRDRIIVKTQNGEETIRLSRSLSTDVMQAESSTAPAPVEFGTTITKSRRHKTVYLDGGTLTAELANLSGIIQEVNVDAVSIYGRLVGVRIHPIAPDSIFSKIGLKIGDVIKEVNGMEITLPEQAIAIFQQLKTDHSVDIKVKGRRTRQIHLIVE